MDPRLEAIYDSLPGLKCQGLCQQACGPVPMLDVEHRPIVAKLGYWPNWKLKRSMTCPLLKDGQCKVYEVRPLLCRLWGVAEDMKCPHGCEPERYLTFEEATSLWGQVLELNGEIYAKLETEQRGDGQPSGMGLPRGS